MLAAFPHYLLEFSKGSLVPRLEAGGNTFFKWVTRVPRFWPLRQSSHHLSPEAARAITQHRDKYFHFPHVPRSDKWGETLLWGTREAWKRWEEWTGSVWCTLIRFPAAATSPRSYLVEFSLTFPLLELAQFRSPLDFFSKELQVLFLLLHIFQELLHAGGFY